MLVNDSKKIDSVVALAVLAIMFVGSASVAHSQTVAYHQDFDTVDRAWFHGVYSEGKTETKNGMYQITKLTQLGDNFFLIPVKFDKTQDFDIETSITFVTGVENQGFGLVFGSSDASNSFCFVISNTGYARLYHIRDGLPIDIQKWRKSSTIAKNGANKLSIRRRGDALTFFVNGSYVAYCSYPFHPFKGNQFGFIINNRMTVSFDYLHIEETPPSPIVEAPDSVKKYIRKRNLGPNVNSKQEDLGPVVSADGNTLYFNRLLHPDNTPPADDRTNSDIWISKRTNDTTWTKAVNMKVPLNNEGGNFVFSVSPDGNTLLLGSLYDSLGLHSGKGVSLTHKTVDGWSLPKPVQIDNFYNRSIYQEFCLSPDGKVMVMCVERDDTQGERDLYISFLKEDGSWSTPRNLGKNVNTAGNEVAPFIAYDGETMYYSTDGLPGYGNRDIFMTRRLDDSWSQWSTPVNLGPTINTKDFDAYYTISAQADYTYFVSYDSSLGRADIFSIELPRKVRPKPVLLISGRVFDSKTRLPIGAKVLYEFLPDGTEAGIARTDPSDGAYKLTLPAGKDYGIRAEAQGYYSASDTADTQLLKEFTTVTKDLYLTPIEVNTVIVLKNIFFDVGKFTLRPESFPEIDRLLKFMGDNPTMEIELGGHSDSVGSVKSNIILSQSRINSVRDYLVQKGIADSRMKAVGYGAAKPVAPNNTEEGRQKNRRVEFSILHK